MHKTTTFIKELKEFAVKGNVIDLAVGVVIGTAFGKIVTSFVSDIITPPLGLMVGGIDFKEWKIIIKQGTVESQEITMNIGLFIQTCIDFALIATAVFVAIKLLGKLKRSLVTKEQEVAQPEEKMTDEQIKLLTEIRDSLKK